MKQIFQLFGGCLIALILWGCNEQTQPSIQDGAPVEVLTEAQKKETTNLRNGSRPFITKWKGKAGQKLKIPIFGTYTLTWYNEATPNERHTEEDVSVDSYVGKFGDEDINFYTFTPPTDGVYVVEAGPEGVEGMLMLFDYAEIFSMKLLSVVQFGDVVWKRLQSAFHNCSDMRFEEGIDIPNLSQCTDLSLMFAGCESFNHPLGSWDVSRVTLMTGMFAGCRSFNQPLEKWDVSKVTDMSDMFTDCTAFNQPLEKWDVSSVTDMSWMFCGCERFNQPLEKWNVSDVTDMQFMFFDCTAFNQSLEAWEINQLPQNGMQSMFYHCPAGKLPFVEKWEEVGYEALDTNEL